LAFASFPLIRHVAFQHGLVVFVKHGASLDRLLSPRKGKRENKGEENHIASPGKPSTSPKPTPLSPGPKPFPFVTRL
jgi:hypothetical protein